MGREIMPDATEDKFVIGQRVVKLPSKTKRLPVDNGRGTRSVKLPGKTTIETFRAPKIYTNPTVMAKNALGRIPEGRALAKIQIQLYNAGFYDVLEVHIKEGWRQRVFKFL